MSAPRPFLAEVDEDELGAFQNLILVSDQGNGAVRLANLSDAPTSYGGITVAPGVMTVVAGSRSGRVGPDRPVAVGVDAQGTVIFSDTGILGGSPSVLQLDPTTRVVTRLSGLPRGTGGGTSGPNQGDGGPALLARLGFPLGLHVDDEGSVYVCDAINRRVRFINRAGADRTPLPGVTVARYGRRRFLSLDFDLRKDDRSWH